jgi:hypothetical protein
MFSCLAFTAAVMFVGVLVLVREDVIKRVELRVVVVENAEVRVDDSVDVSKEVGTGVSVGVSVLECDGVIVDDNVAKGVGVQDNVKVGLHVSVVEENSVGVDVGDRDGDDLIVLVGLMVGVRVAIWVIIRVLEKVRVGV